MVYAVIFNLCVTCSASNTIPMEYSTKASPDSLFAFAQSMAVIDIIDLSFSIISGKKPCQTQMWMLANEQQHLDRSFVSLPSISFLLDSALPLGFFFKASMSLKTYFF